MSEIIENSKVKMNKTIENLEKEFMTIRTGKANASMLDRVEVMYYGFKTPLNQVASVSVVESRQIMVKPFDKTTLKDIEKGILEADLGLNPGNDGSIIRIVIPTLTEERRKELVKIVYKVSEESKVAIRNIRRDANDFVKKNKEFSEDEKKKLENDVQKLTDEFIKKIDVMSQNKEKEVMAI